MKINLGVALDLVEDRLHQPEPTYVSYNPELKKETKDRLEKVRLGLRDYRLHVLKQRPNIKWKRFKSLKLFG